MFIARWQIDAKFGHKQLLTDMMRRWLKEVAPQVGADKMQPLLTTGSIGALEGTIYVDHKIESLAELERMFEAVGKSETHKRWTQEMEPLVVSGTSRWEILRVL